MSGHLPGCATLESRPRPATTAFPNQMFRISAATDVPALLSVVLADSSSNSSSDSSYDSRDDTDWDPEDDSDCECIGMDCYCFDESTEWELIRTRCDPDQFGHYQGLFSSNLQKWAHLGTCPLHTACLYQFDGAACVVNHHANFLHAEAGPYLDGQRSRCNPDDPTHVQILFNGNWFHWDQCPETHLCRDINEIAVCLWDKAPLPPHVRPKIFPIRNIPCNSNNFTLIQLRVEDGFPACSDDTLKFFDYPLEPTAPNFHGCSSRCDPENFTRIQVFYNDSWIHFATCDKAESCRDINGAAACQYKDEQYVHVDCENVNYLSTSYIGTMGTDGLVRMAANPYGAHARDLKFLSLCRKGPDVERDDAEEMDMVPNYHETKKEVKRQEERYALTLRLRGTLTAYVNH
ncbi:hypothetical protein BS50DRAFT_640195 [Corynespora cassiicola Philippines]|uniref:Uncharacterized protein n=1 Tax=Corynespora cassiicola Philippines TaxID=1448308 RepID=A0A2T2N4S6_CORCC|nr:hypothetical protein BS50DRAFT_640195 [Corynespora cassiicola Philippines]